MRRRARPDGDTDLSSSTVVRSDTDAQPNLPIIERCIYWAGYIGFIAYATYKVYLAGNEYEEYLPAYGFNSGWSFIGRQQDVTNFEWSFWSSWSLKIIPWLLGHIILSRIVALAAPKWCPHGYLTLGIVALTALLGWKAMLLFLTHAIIAYFSAVLTRSVWVVWITDLLLLSTLNFNPFSDLMKGLFEDDPYELQYYLLIFTTAMLNIRYISFGLEMCRKPEEGDTVQPSDKLVDMLVYCFYFPLFFCGPLMNYDTFQYQMNQPPKRWNKPRVIEYLQTAVRLVFWWFAYEVATHFLYIDALLQDQHIMQTCSKWVITGIAYLSGQLFMVKYVLMFGLPTLVARFDNLDPPKGPMCISRVYLYSQMWKCFDRGLYAFLKRHIYIPLGGSSRGIVRQLFASLACFLFIFYWHGAEHYLYVWTALNFIGITIEAARKSVTRLPALQTYQFPFSPVMERRFTALLTVPLLGLSTFGYFFFMAGSEVGEIYARRLLVGGVTTSLIALSYYFQIQVSMDIEGLEKKRL